MCASICLPSSMTSVDLQVAACHETTRIAHDKHRRSSILVRLAQFTQHVLRGPIAAALGVLLEESFYHCGDDVTGRKSVYSDSVGAPFSRKVAGELQYAGFLHERRGEINIGPMIRSKAGIRTDALYAGQIRPLLATVPLIDPMSRILPPRCHRIISLATACAVINTPVMLTSRAYHISLS